MAANKKTTAPEAPVQEFDSALVLAQLQALTERVQSAENENARLQAALEEAKTTGAFTDEFGNKVNILTGAMAGANAQIHDKPGTLIEKLDIMEKQAHARRETFDRERTRKILMGEPVEDLLEFICDRCGRGEERWNGHPELFEAHVQFHLTGKRTAYQNRRKIRAVDEADAGISA